MDNDFKNVLNAWAVWFSKRLDRINNGSKEDYSGYEWELFETIQNKFGVDRKEKQDE